MCSSPIAKRHVLCPLDSTELEILVEKFSSKVISDALSSSTVFDKFKTASSGFPFLAVELLREAEADFKSSTLSSDTSEMGLSTTGGAAGVSSDAYTEEELDLLNFYYDMHKSNVGWRQIAWR